MGRRKKRYIVERRRRSSSNSLLHIGIILPIKRTICSIKEIIFFPHSNMIKLNIYNHFIPMTILCRSKNNSKDYVQNKQVFLKIKKTNRINLKRRKEKQEIYLAENITDNINQHQEVVKKNHLKKKIKKNIMLKNQSILKLNAHYKNLIPYKFLKHTIKMVFNSKNQHFRFL